MRLNKRGLLAAVVVAGLFLAVALTLPLTLTPALRARLVAALNERFDSDVELQSLRVSVLPRPRVVGTGLRLRHKARRDVAPLITVDAFSAEASLFGLFGRTLRVTRVHLRGLAVTIPPGGVDLDDTGTRGDVRGDRRGTARRPDGEAQPPARERPAPPKPSPIVVDDLRSEHARLTILRRDPGKTPRVFEIHHLAMQDAGADTPWAFRATLTNPTPPGEIQTRGTFGPWNAAEPASTRLNAQYEFRDANLGVFKGVRGTLSSTGAFKGVLERIEVDGRANVPDFALDKVGQPVSLETRFHSIVDGTNGNTLLQPVEAKFLRTTILANGGVIARDGDGRTVTLDVVLNDARIEDVLRLAVKARQPHMTGRLTMKAKFVLPPGKVDVVEKLDLEGSFEILGARFTKGSVQAKVNVLSQKAQGEIDEPPDEVLSDFTGRFVMRDGTIRFSTVSFAVPGARVNVGGAYALRSEALDFRGTARLDAKPSQMTTGIKSLFLKLIDPLLRRGDVTVLPITLRGTVDEPKFGLDVKRTLTRK